MKIGNKIITRDDLYFWLEEGQASLGNFDVALKYIDAASEVGADGIEFQLAIPEEFYVSSHPYIEHYKKIQYSRDQIKQLIEYAHKKDIHFIAAVLSRSLISWLAEHGCDAFVLNASDINNPDLIDRMVESKVPFFISLPLATPEEIKWVVERCNSLGANNYVLMLGQHTMASGEGEHGVMPQDTNLGYLDTLKRRYGLPVGYIDHSTSSAIPSIAAAAGANFISKHISLDKSERGPDWFVCQEPDEMKATIQYARKIRLSLSNEEKVLAPGENMDRSLMRRSIVAAKFIPKGTAMTIEMMDFKRPGGGIPPNDFESLIGKIAMRNLEKDEIIETDDLENGFSDKK